MQTTQTTSDFVPSPAAHSSAEGHRHAPQKHEPQKQDAKHETLDVVLLIQQLVDEEAELRWRAQELERHAHELDDGDDESQMQADRLRAKRSEELVLADEMKAAVSELKADPSRKAARHKAGGLAVQASHIISDGENEAEAATVVSATSTEHKVAVHHAVIHEGKAEAKEHEKKEKAHELKPILKATKEKKSTGLKTKTNVQGAKQTGIKPPAQMSQPMAPRMWGIGAPMVASGVSYSPWGQVSTASLVAPQNAALPWNGIGLFGSQLVEHQVPTVPVSGVTGQVVAAVRNVAIPNSIGPLVSLPPSAVLTPSIFAAPWNQFPPFPTHS